MNGPAHKNHPMKRMNRLMQPSFLCVLLVLALARMATAADALYENNGIVSYPGTESFPPVIDATNFVNNGSFTINFTTIPLGQPLYETSDTINYTNNGSMVANTGFNFDNQSTSTGSRTMAGSFDNPGTISCGSINDSGTFFSGFGQFNAWATNIVNSGTNDVGVDGLMQFTGQNVDLTRSFLTIEGFGLFSDQGVFGVSAAFGTDTNGDWVPSVDLTTTTASSSEPIVLDLINTTPYFETNAVGTNLVIVRAVFLYNPSPNVTNNVYFGVNTVSPGAATIEWVGTYLDAASGATLNNYLYLNDDYLLGSSTNVVIGGTGIPDNFTFLSTTAPLPLGAPTPSGFPPGFAFQPAGAVTNTYSYVNAQITASTVSTNSSSNPTHSITNLPGRIQISASKELNLSLAQITGANYMSLQASNQFDGSAGAFIAVPYSDINIGVTNGFLTVSNLMEAAIPNWSGNIQAWSGRWIFTDANGVTNDYRVLLVSSQIAPTAPAQVQDLFMHGTNIVISDALNVTRKLFADAQSLTLTTNGPGVGATSLDGELNLFSSGILWPSALPNMRWLTNNGAIRTLNLAEFISSPATVTVTAGTPAVAATGTLSESGPPNVVNNDKVTIGSSQYAFVNSLNNATPNQIKVDTTFDNSMSNLIAAINHTTGSGSKYSSATTTNTQVTAGSLTSHAFTVTAIVAGAAGNSIVTTETPAHSAHLAWSHGTLTGGVDSIPGTTNVSTVQVPYGAFVNNGLLSDQGSTIYADYFENGGTVTNSGTGSFILQSVTAILTNGSVTAGGDFSITAGSLLASNVVIQAGRQLTLTVTNLLTDTGPSPTNGNIWSVGGSSSSGLNLPIKPVAGDLLGTTFTNTALANKNVINIWAATNFGISVAGYTNNAAVGRLILDAQGPSSLFTFNGIGTNNALYVDYLELRDYATNRDGSGNPTALTNNPGLFIYYAQAVQNGVSVADKLNHKNSDHLRWVSAYNGYFSSTNLVFGGTTNAVNAALAQSTTLDSDGDGTPNASDPSPVFVSSEVAFTLTLTNVPPLKVRLQWQAIPSATNYVFYKTNLVSASWLLLTNFVSATNVPPVGGWPVTNSVTDPVNPVQPRYYRVRVDPNSILTYGP